MRPTITTTMVKEMTELRELGVPIARIARQFKLNEETVRRHTSAEDAETVRAYQKRRYERDIANPEVMERRRAGAREYARRKREADKRA